MNQICFLIPTIKKYAWGSRKTLAELLGKAPSSEPQAELWMGAHPLGDSFLESIDGRPISLQNQIQSNPIDILGQQPALDFNHELPFLFKVLAVDAPLSLQAHPDRAQARAGFEFENSKKIPLDAAERNFKDPNAKPELICAISSFWALNGFRPLSEILTEFRAIACTELTRIIADLDETRNPQGLVSFFNSLMDLSEDRKESVLESCLRFAEERATKDSVYSWMLKLSQAHPQDIGILSPLFLNLIHLLPGQAMLLPSRQLHCYLEGTAIELMGNSDNVFRGGLTRKHIDREGLSRILNFTPEKISVFEAKPISQTERVFDTRQEEFSLSVIQTKPPLVHQSHAKRNIEILICMDGAGEIQSGEQTLSFKKGSIWMVPAASSTYRICGNATLYKATVPLKRSES